MNKDEFKETLRNLELMYQNKQITWKEYWSATTEAQRNYQESIRLDIVTKRLEKQADMTERLVFVPYYTDPVSYLMSLGCSSILVLGAVVYLISLFL